MDSATAQAPDPQGSFLAAARGDRALVAGYYRLIEHPDTERVNAANLLALHRERTLQRMQTTKTALAIQGGTDFNFADRGAIADRKLIGKNKRSKGTLGLHLHSTYVVDERGLPLGVARMEFDAPNGAAEKDRLIPERKTGRWLRGLDDCAEMAERLTDTQVIAVMDREADVFALFERAARLPRVEVLLRAKHDRVLQDGTKPFDAMRKEPIRDQASLTVERWSARRAGDGRKEKPLRAARDATLELRWRRFDLANPLNRVQTTPTTLVHVRESGTPADGGAPLEWFLLTSLPVDSGQDARRILQRYRLRRRIEDWRRVLKSGCKVEDVADLSRQLQERAITVNAVTAWRLAALVLLGQDVPDLPAEAFFTEFEIAALQDFATLHPARPQPDRLAAAITLVAMLGGYLHRKHDPPPGMEVMWRGYVRLTAQAEVYQRLVEVGSGSALYRLVRPD